MPKPFWDVEEDIGFVKIQGSDGVPYKVWDSGTPEEQIATAEALVRVRRDINTLLNYILQNPDDWSQHPIAFGIYHTFDLHLPGWNTTSSFGSSSKNYFVYQEMTPNTDNIIGLNKPKETKFITVDLGNNKKMKYEIGKKRKIFLTLRNQRTGQLRNYSDILDLAIHELTHTTCNDIKWKEDNHKDPYPLYHRMMRKWAKECNLIRI
jgi:hypothetical protein